jgi:glycosyltransferase involved in cell wall biosynthesis
MVDGEREKISLVLTSYNRDAMTIRAYSGIVDDERIGEVIIVDDCSADKYKDRLKRLANHPKVKLFLNQKNLGCYKNKAYAISQATFGYVIILDSDNYVDKSYLDAVYSCDWEKGKILAPDFAKPHFNYTNFSGKTIDRQTVKQHLPTGSKTRFDCLMNTMNYFVNKDEYLRVWDANIEPWTADTIYQNYQWLKAGNVLYIVPGMQYEHLVHSGSHYQEHNSKTGNLYREIENKIMKL